jgi:hypothetical protein
MEAKIWKHKSGNVLLKSLGYPYSRSWVILEQRVTEYLQLQNIDTDANIGVLLSRIEDLPEPRLHVEIPVVRRARTQRARTPRAPSTRTPRLRKPKPPPEFKTPTPYIQSPEYLRSQQERELKKHVLQQRLVELQHPQALIKQELDELDIKHEQRKYQSKVQQSLLQQIPIVANAFHSPDIPEEADDDIDNVLAATFLDLATPAPPSPVDAFNPASYAEFRRQRTARAKNDERSILKERFDELDAHPFGYQLNLDDIHNRELITPMFKSFFKKHVLPSNDKIVFKYIGLNGQWHTRRLLDVLLIIQSDFDSVGFEYDASDGEFDRSDAPAHENTHILPFISAFRFDRIGEMKAPEQSKETKPRKGRQGAFFPYLLKPEFQTPHLNETLEKYQIFAEGANITFAEPTGSTSSKPPKYQARLIDYQWVVVDVNEPMPVDNCFIHAIKQQDASDQMIDEIRLIRGKAAEIKDMDIDRIARVFRLHVIIHDVQGYKQSKSRTYGVLAAEAKQTFKLVRYLGHYFTNELTSFTKYYIDNMATLSPMKSNHRQVIKNGKITSRRAEQDKYYLNTEELVSLLFSKGAFRPMTNTELIQYKAYNN